MPRWPLVSSATYLPSGPLTGLALGNFLTETRLFDARYYPDRIQVPSRLDWDCTVDAVGNPTLVSDLLAPAGSRTYGYQDYQYFLTSAAGPWSDLTWTYDRIGNRLSEDEIGEPLPFTYSYLQNGTGGNTPKLTQIQPRPNDNGNGAITQSYDPAGNQITHQSANQIAGPKGSGKTSTFTYSGESKLSGIAETPGMASTVFQYDGRGFLRDALLTNAEPGDFEHTEPVYSSSGQLFGRRWRSRRTFGTPQDDGTVGRIMEDQTAHVFYFAGRPVAQLTIGATGPGSGLVYLTADHLGTPVLATNTSGTTNWSGGFSPFGAPYLLMPPTLFLRLPGQWTDRAWEALGGGGIYYNVNRWYGAGVGRYEKPDPLGQKGDSQAYAYSRLNPLRFVDRLGLLSFDESCFGCLGQNVGDPRSPTQLGAIVQGVRNGCRKFLPAITDIGLRGCIAKSCQDGKIDCRTNNWRCGPGKLGHENDTFLPGLPVTRKIVLCVNNWDILRNVIGETAVHEFAHGCGWFHGQGGGVPGNEGAGFEGAR